MSKQRIVSNLLIMGAGQVVTWAISALYLVLVSRYLGPVRQGELTLALSVVTVVGLVIGLGMDTLITRTVARTPERASVLASAALVVRGALAIPALGVLYIYAHTTRLNAETRAATYIIAVSMIVGSLGGVLVATFQGREQMSRGTITAIVQNVLGLGFAVVVMWRHAGVVAFATVGVPVEVLLLALNLCWMRRFARLTWRVSPRDVWEVIVGSLAFWANNVFLTIYMYIDAVILAALAGTPAVGMYAPPTRLFSVALFVPTIIAAATLPLLSRLGIEAGADFMRVSRKTLSLLIACALPLTIGLATFAGPLILTVFGAAYRLSVPVLVVLSLCIPCTFLNIQFSQMLAARDQQWRWTAIMAVSCVVNPLVNVALIPLAERRWHNGALGAALALLATEVLMAAYGSIVLHDLLADRALGRTVVAAVAAGAAQAAALWLTAALWPPAGEALGLAAYGSVAVALGALPREDVAQLYDTIARRAQPLLVQGAD